VIFVFKRRTYAKLKAGQHRIQAVDETSGRVAEVWVEAREM
jgi:hypothetical protein